MSHGLEIERRPVPARRTVVDHAGLGRSAVPCSKRHPTSNASSAARAVGRSMVAAVAQILARTQLSLPMRVQTIAVALQMSSRSARRGSTCVSWRSPRRWSGRYGRRPSGLSRINGSARAEPCLLAGRMRCGGKIPHGRRRKSGRGRSAGRRHRARDHAGRADGRPVADRDRARLSGAHLALDRERASRASSSTRGCSPSTRKRRFAYYRIASPLVAAHAGKHQGGRRDRGAAAAPAALGARTTRCASPAPATTIWPASVGVAIADALVARGHVVLSDEGGEVTRRGRAVPLLVRRRSRAARRQPAHVLPALPRLERAPLSHQGRRRRRRSSAAAWSSAGSSASATAARCG